MSNHILLLDPSIASSNIGDDIIMECVSKELEFVINDNFVYHLSTHVASFHWYQVLRNSLALRNYSDCMYKFVCGSNLLVKNMLTHYPQWNINIFNYKPFKDCILVGVGAGAGDSSNLYTRFLYKKMLNKNYYHSVRDERSKFYLESLGLKAINTGCATMWMLTPDFCKQIPTKKASRVVFTLTASDNPLDADQKLLDILTRNYKKVYFWVQGDRDLQYLQKFGNTQNITIIPPTKKAYETILQEDDLDYVGTRLHAGIYAMRHTKRSIIIVIDERAREINKSNNLICLERNQIASQLERLIESDFETHISMPFDEIQRWKEQFV